VAPILAAWIISISGGVSVAGLRPLYGIQIGIFASIFLLLVGLLRDPATGGGERKHGRFLSGVTDVFRQGPDLVRVMWMLALMELPWSMAQPFMPLYAHQYKGADEFVLGGIGVAITVAPLLVSIPLGRLADRYGRKKLLFSVAPLAYAANLCLIFATGRNMLFLYGLFFGFNSISMAISSAMAAEIVPKSQMGRWIGIVTMVRGLTSVPAPLLGGVIWKHVGPQYVFAAAILIDLCVRLPLLACVRETLYVIPGTAGDGDEKGAVNVCDKGME
jgi:MFS family permease